MMQRRKGKRGEQEAVNTLKGWGFPDARRTKQHDGKDSADVECPETLPGVWIEVKRMGADSAFRPGSKALLDACNQAARDAAGRPWVVLWRPDRSPWWSATTDGNGMLATVAGDHDIPALLCQLQEQAEAQP